MIGKSLNERFKLAALSAETATATLKELLVSHAKPLVEVRAKDARMIACAFVRAEKPALRLCRSLGLDLEPGATAVFGLLGDDAARLFPDLPERHRAWLAAPCGPRETKVLLVAGGIGLLSLEASDGKVAITSVP